MFEEMELRRLSATTRLRVGRVALAQQYRGPQQLSATEPRRYFLHLANEKKIAELITTTSPRGIKFFYEPNPEATPADAALCAAAREWKLPVVGEPGRSTAHSGCRRVHCPKHLLVTNQL